MGHRSLPVISGFKIQSVQYHVECTHKGEQVFNRIFISRELLADKNIDIEEHLKKEMQAFCKNL